MSTSAFEVAKREIGTDVSTNAGFDSGRFFALASDFLIQIDRSAATVGANSSAVTAFGRTTERDGLTIDLLSCIEDDDQRQAAVAAARFARRTGRASWRGTMRRTDGASIYVDASMVYDAMHDEIVVVGRDSTAERLLTLELARQATTDSLTGLANRAHFINRLTGALHAGTPTILFCDLDRFKVINDSFGHTAGDEVLQRCGRRLQSIGEPSGYLTARLGGDEFAVLIPNSRSDADARTAAQCVRSELSLPLELRGHRIVLDVCVGIATSRASGMRTARDLLGAADKAVYAAKARGRGRVVVYDQALLAQARLRFDTEEQIRIALDADQIEPHYQPIISLADNELIGSEALVRLRLPSGNLLPPAAFLPVAEDAGLMASVDEMVARAVFADFASRNATTRVALNAAPAQLCDPEFPDRLQRLAQTHRFDLNRLTIELTESSILTDFDGTKRNMEALRGMGVRIALDDFGTGYSSLAHLRLLPIDTLKIDRSFTSTMLVDQPTRAILDGVLHVCDALGIYTVGEGIETYDEAVMLTELGCNAGQGYFFHRPMPSDNFWHLVSNE